MIDNSMKALIHILKNKYNLSDTDYRTLLDDMFNVVSCIDLTEEQANIFIHTLNYKYNNDYKLGFDRALAQLVQTKDLDYIISVKYNRKPTELELKMFNSLDDKEQKALLSDIMQDKVK